MVTRAAAMIPSTFVAHLTPFDAQGRIDEDQMRAHFRRLAAAGIGVYVAGSGSGEGLTLSRQETFRLYEIAREELRGRVPVRAMGYEPASAAEILELANLAVEAGLDAMNVYAVRAEGVKERETEEFFSDVVSQLGIPVVLSIHHAVGYSVTLEVLRKLVARFERIIGVTCARADLAMLQSIGKSVAVHITDISQVFTHLAIGGHGWAGQEGNLVPRLCVSLIERFKAGDLVQAAKDYALLLRVREQNVKHMRIQGMKAALTMLGHPMGYPRKPLLPPTADELQHIRAALDDLDVPSIERFASRAG